MPKTSSLAVEPGSSARAARGVPPDGCASELGSASSTFICCAPPAKAIWSFPHSKKSNSTRPVRLLRHCRTGATGDPAPATSIVVPQKRAKLPIQPRSTQGEGGASRLNIPCLAGSNIVADSAERSTAAK